MAHRSKRTHIRHEHEHEREEAVHRVHPRPIAPPPPQDASISRLAGQLVYAIARRIARRIFARPLRAMEHARAAFSPRTEVK